MSQDLITYLLLALVFGAVVLGVLAIAPLFSRRCTSPGASAPRSTISLANG